MTAALANVALKLDGCATAPTGVFAGPAPGCERMTPALLRSGDTAPMGYDPYRNRRTTQLDYWLVAAAAFVAAGLVIWALLG
ncbi:hypothetical protein [Candidatus Poriferisodalis sp.]|uniref:hypothetical protein n=1 Tax=Candidatus Poriferisodalis sp. TaxID=3101277 RepID=UPI003B02486D